MLDQNTDRMWFVIGALVVGAGIILLANKAMPEMFASVMDSFENVADESIGSIENINKNYFDPDNILTEGVLYWETGKYDSIPTYKNNAVTDFIPVIPGETIYSNYVPHRYYYDENRNYIGSIGGRYSNVTEQVDITFVVPGAGANYDTVVSDTAVPAYMRLRYGGHNLPFIGIVPLDNVVINKMSIESD